MVLNWNYYASDKSGGTSGTGDYLLHLPSGYTMDSGKVSYYTTDEGYGDFTPASATKLGDAFSTDNSGGVHFTGHCFAYDDTKFRLMGLVTTHSTVTRHAVIGSGNGYSFANMNTFKVQVRIPIAGWTSTFNPVLSMPLVDLGQPVETWFRSMTSDSNFWDGTGVQRQWNEALLVGPNTSSTVAGNIANSNLISIEDKTSGSNTVTAIVAKQDIVLTAIISSYINSTGNIYWLNQNDQTLSTEQTHNSDNYIENCPVEVYLRAGEYIWAQTDAYANDGGITITAKKVQSGNMAHIIKPAVATISHENSSYGIWGGDLGSSNTWTTRTLNTLKGETWFIESLSSNVFTLEKGMYKITGQAPLYAGNSHKIRLYNTTDSEVTLSGGNAYSSNAYNGQAPALMFGVFTITKSTAFRIEHILHTDKGGISQGGFDSGGTNSGPSIFTILMLEKLK